MSFNVGLHTKPLSFENVIQIAPEEIVEIGKDDICKEQLEILIQSQWIFVCEKLDVEISRFELMEV